MKLLLLFSQMRPVVGLALRTRDVFDCNGGLFEEHCEQYHATYIDHMWFMCGQCHMKRFHRILHPTCIKLNQCAVSLTQHTSLPALTLYSPSCLANMNGKLVWQSNGLAFNSCVDCRYFGEYHGLMTCSCKNDTGAWINATIDPSKFTLEH